ncbi:MULTISPECIES: retron St85 family effector protein [Serratia]|nr:retron St85 family effector protein [Serratia marcescens]
MIINNIHEKDFNSIAREINGIIKDGLDDSKKIIFLCGKDKSDKNSYRHKISLLLEKEKNYQLAYPEDLFEDLLEGQAGNSLLALEEQLAEAVDLIILIPESPGSFAELGAFSMRKELASKMLILRQGKYKSDKSFINHGPIRLVKTAKGHVQDIPSNFDVSSSIYSAPITRQIRKMIPSGRKKRNIDNILMYQNHILLLVYLFDDMTQSTLNKLLGIILNRRLKSQDYTASKAAIHSLIRSSLIEKNHETLQIKDKGFQDINTRYYAINEINALRIKIMNKQLGRQLKKSV